MKNRLFELLAVIIRPHLWVNIRTYDAYCDAWCRESLQNPTIEIIDRYRAYFNGKEVWIANKADGFEFESFHVRPSRYIGWKMMKLIEPLAVEASELRKYFKA